MNTMSESPTRPREESQTGKILVWDAPVRLFHWLMVASFAGAWLTAESEQWRGVHVTLGYTMAGLVMFRIAWGLCGTRYARFAEFVRGPAAVARYVSNLLRGRHERYAGHNPAGAIAILALLGLTLLVTVTGWMTYSDLAGGSLEEAHEAIATLMLAIVGAHVVAVIWTSWRFRENLIGAMITGRKPGKPDQGIGRAWHGLAAVMLAAVFGFWWAQSLDTPPAGSGASAKNAVAHDRHQDKDDD